ncbi:hypothetical protein K503DRAFT_856816 [Rhizopogon vinicolor AM-OR11-026]|uniref:Uncharacterized protein n=1 Tax=Rhizopogon vinicolor AM-OR11-026 TaxID=1314800 RepID=A0A1B7N053_9AGAM|nr:hypothetical protein K503DRAFT_856816 [Rhizopogon vinicolor AM-OR11-026]
MSLFESIIYSTSRSGCDASGNLPQAATCGPQQHYMYASTGGEYILISIPRRYYALGFAVGVIDSVELVIFPHASYNGIPSTKSRFTTRRPLIRGMRILLVCQQAINRGSGISGPMLFHLTCVTDHIVRVGVQKEHEEASMDMDVDGEHSPICTVAIRLA